LDGMWPEEMHKLKISRQRDAASVEALAENETRRK